MATICVSGLALLKAGSGVSTDLTGSGVFGLTAQAIIDQWIEEAEAQISLFSRYDWVGNFGSADTNFKPNLVAFVSNLAAIHCVKYNMAGYTSRIEAEDLINVLRDEVLRIGQLLRDQKGVTFGKG